MTIKELSDVAGVSRNTVNTTAKKLFPNKFKNGVRTIFDEYQSMEIMREVTKKNMVALQNEKLPSQNEKLPTQKLEVDYGAIGKMIGIAVSAALSPVVTELRELKQNNVLQIKAPKQDYFSLIAYCSLHKIKTVSSELRKMGMDLRKMSKESGKELHKIPDERYGQVNSYPVEILEEYFSE